MLDDVLHREARYAGGLFAIVTWLEKGRGMAFGEIRILKGEQKRTKLLFFRYLKKDGAPTEQALTADTSSSLDIDIAITFNQLRRFHLPKYKIYILAFFQYEQCKINQ